MFTLELLKLHRQYQKYFQLAYNDLQLANMLYDKWGIGVSDSHMIQ